MGDGRRKRHSMSYLTPAVQSSVLLLPSNLLGLTALSQLDQNNLRPGRIRLFLPGLALFQGRQGSDRQGSAGRGTVGQAGYRVAIQGLAWRDIAHRAVPKHNLPSLPGSTSPGIVQPSLACLA